MKPENAIEIKSITKGFKVYFDKGNTIKDKIVSIKRHKYENRKVLNGISFDVKRGEAIGLIGQNGCGKSTTLKLLTRIMYPDTGTIEIKGRVSSLIELGAGFHPDMSGRENIYINASIFGLSRREIDFRLADIIAFSELEEFIDNPVRTYSSGMYMRLAFSVAINVDADVLLIDEILAVGDANFQAKCFNRLREIKANGATIVIVSHSLAQIEQICERSLWIQDGIIKKEGSPREVHPEYLDFMGKKRQCIAEAEEERKREIKQNRNDDSASNPKINTEKEQGQNEEENQEKKDEKRWGNGFARIRDVKLLNEDAKDSLVFETGKYMKIVIGFNVYQAVKNAIIGIGIFRVDGLQCYGTNTRIDDLKQFDLKEDGTVEVEIENLNLLPNQYTMDIAIESEISVPVDYIREVKKFEVYSKTEDVGVSRILHMWKIN